MKAYYFKKGKQTRFFKQIHEDGYYLVDARTWTDEHIGWAPVMNRYINAGRAQILMLKLKDLGYKMTVKEI